LLSKGAYSEVHGWGSYYIRQYILHNHVVTKFRLNKNKFSETKISGCVTGGAGEYWGVLGVLGIVGFSITFNEVLGGAGTVWDR
jgi:hypothetical protein